MTNSPCVCMFDMLGADEIDKFAFVIANIQLQFLLRPLKKPALLWK